jgi:hypothetical protein
MTALQPFSNPLQNPQANLISDHGRGPNLFYGCNLEASNALHQTSNYIQDSMGSSISLNTAHSNEYDYSFGQPCTKLPRFCIIEHQNLMHHLYQNRAFTQLQQAQPDLLNPSLAEPSLLDTGNFFSDNPFDSDFAEEFNAAFQGDSFL